MNRTCLGAWNIELWSLEISIQIVNVDQSVVLFERKDFSILPCHKETRHRAALPLVFSWQRAENESVELAIIDSVVHLIFGKWWQFADDLHFCSFEVACIIYIDGVWSYLTRHKFLLFIEFD